jgi:glycosyltransferase involved in cell wall biosynthesis
LKEEHFSFLNRHVAKLTANLFVDHLLTNSHATLEAFHQLGGRVPARVVPNGIDVSRFLNVEPSVRSNLRASLAIPCDAPVVGVFSRIASWKGQDILVRTLPDIPELHVAIVGDAMFEGDQAYDRDLRALTHELGVHDRVHFCGFRRDIPDLMHMVDIVAHTSKAPEPFGRVIVEGLLAERPVIATRAGGAQEILSTPSTGYLVDPGSVYQLRDTLRHVISHPDEAHQFACKGKALALKRYSLPTMVASITSAIRHVASTAPTP